MREKKDGPCWNWKCFRRAELAKLQNVRAVREGTRIFSAYELRDGTRIWIITEADPILTPS